MDNFLQLWNTLLPPVSTDNWMLHRLSLSLVDWAAVWSVGINSILHPFRPWGILARWLITFFCILFWKVQLSQCSQATAWDRIPADPCSRLSLGKSSWPLKGRKENWKAALPVPALHLPQGLRQLCLSLMCTHLQKSEWEPWSHGSEVSLDGLQAHNFSLGAPHEKLYPSWGFLPTTWQKMT